ncbi:MAG: hypothetical protein E6J91_03170 [Deltaproteobacteria bacterium]|nr:MAG: hypothetical protein E6J91_03170 [Deltaproteobacteria bacterium]
MVLLNLKLCWTTDAPKSTRAATRLAPRRGAAVATSPPSTSSPSSAAATFFLALRGASSSSAAAFFAGRVGLLGPGVLVVGGRRLRLLGGPRVGLVLLARLGPGRLGGPGVLVLARLGLGRLGLLGRPRLGVLVVGRLLGDLLASVLLGRERLVVVVGRLLLLGRPRLVVVASRDADLVDHLVVQQRAELLGLGVLEAHREALGHLLVDEQPELQRLGGADLVELAGHDRVGLELGRQLLEVLLGEIGEIAELVDGAVDLAAADQRQLLALDRLGDRIADVTAGIALDLGERHLWLGRGSAAKREE